MRDADTSVLTGDHPAESDPLIPVIKGAFNRVNESFFDYMHRKSSIESCGSTGLVALIKNKRLYICWCGDSEAMFESLEHPATKVCRPHKAGNPDEVKRIEELGGYVQEVGGTSRLNGILAVSRSFGDARYDRQ